MRLSKAKCLKGSGRLLLGGASGGILLIPDQELPRKTEALQMCAYAAQPCTEILEESSLDALPAEEL